MKKLKLFFACLLMAVLSIGQVWAGDPVTIASGTFDGKNATYTEGWSTTGTGKGRNDCIIVGSGEDITSPSIDLSLYESITIAIKSRRYGSLSGNKATIAVSFAGESIGSVDATSTTATTSLTNIEYTVVAATSKTSTFVFTCSNATSAGSSHGAGINSITITGVAKSAAPTCENTVSVAKVTPENGDFDISATEVCGDGDGGEVTISNIEPATGYTLDEVSVTVGTYNALTGKVTGITANTEITVTFKALPKYTVSFNVGGSAASQADITEASAGAGITLPAGPTPTCSAAGWEFAGWAAAAVASQTTTAPTLLSAGDTYHPTSNCTLYAVYKKGEGTAETWNPITSAPDDWSGDYVLENSGYAMTSDFNVSGEFAGAAVTITDGKVVSPTDKMIWTFAKNGENAQYSLKNKSTGTYANITGTSSKNAGLSESAVWFTLSYSSSNVWQINSVTNSTRCFAYYQNNFRTYANSTASNGVNLYKKSGGATYYYLSNPTCTPPAVADPVISLAEGEYEGTQSVTITCETTGAAIYYTTDGSDPTSGSTLYGSAISVSASQTIKAIAIKDEAESNIVSAEYTIVTTCETPTFSLAEGEYEGTQSVEISCTRADVAIYYTTDGTDPTTGSTLYEGPISVSASQTIKAIATKTGLTNSAIASASYTIIAGPDVVLDLVDGNWSFPTSDTKTLTEYTNSETGYAVKCYAATAYKVSGTSYFIIGKSGSYIELPTFASPVERIVVTKGGGSSPSGSVVFNIFDGDDAVSTAVTGCGSDQTFEIENPEAGKTYTLKVTSAHNLQLAKINIYFGAAPAVAKPSISGEEYFLSSAEVTMTCATEGATIYYTTTESAKATPATSGDWAAYNSASKPSFSATTTVWAAAKLGDDWSAVAEQTFTKGTVMTVAQARAAIDAGGDLTNKFVVGIISQIDSYNSTYNSITYWISDDGTTTDQLQVYSGLAGVVKAAFTSEDDLAVGDDVTVKGTLKKYSSTYEFDKNNTIEAYKPIARLSWSAESFDAALEGANTFPTLTNTNSVSVSYSSSNISAATISNEEGHEGEISLVAVGSTTITASFAGNETYKANSASYELTVASSLVTLTYNVDGGEAIDPANVSALPNPLPTTIKAGKNFGGWFTDSEKEVAAVPGAAITENTTLYAKWLDPYTVSEAKTVIDANPTGTENQYVAGIISQIDSYNNTYHSITYWISADGTTTNQLQVYSGLIGNAATALEKEQFTAKTDLELGDEVVVTGTLKLHNSTTYEFDKNNTIYTFSRKASAGLEWSESSFDAYIGESNTFPSLTNDHNVAVAYSSTETDYATISNEEGHEGEITLVAEGETVIKATFAGNATYKAAEVSYTLHVHPAVVHASITYVENGANEDIADVADATELPDPLPTVTKDNFLFGGWWTTSTFEDGTEAVAGASLSDDVTLYAKWNAIPPYALVYTSNVEFTGKNSFESGGSKVVIAEVEYDAQKVGASSNQGQVVVTVPAKTHTLHFHVFTWKNKTNVISISGVTNPSVSTFDVIGDNGGGASSPYTIEGNPIDHYYAVTFDAVSEVTEITFDYSSGGDKRFIMYGINQEGGVLPVLDHIVITGTASATEYEAGDVFNPAGLGVNAIYTLAEEEQDPVAVDAADIEWSFAPAILTAETESVTVTASYGGKSANKSVDVTVTTPSTPEIIATPASINFGTVNQNAAVAAQGISVTLKAVAAATVTLDGDGFTIDKDALSELNSTITVTPVTTATGTFAATITISDDADAADDVVINLSMTVEAVEDLSGTWVKATSVAAGDRIIIGATVSGETKTMGQQNSKNRAAVASILADGVLTPGEGTKTFLVVHAGDGKFALQALNGKYLTSTTSGTGNELLEAANYENDNAKWTISIDGEGVASVVAAAGSRTYMKYNNGSTLFSCYQYETSQTAINIYKKGAAPEPEKDIIRSGLSNGKWGTLCPTQNVENVEGATFYQITSLVEKDGMPYNMVFDQISGTTLTAGEPYFFIANAAEIRGNKTGDVLDAAGAGVNGFYGYIGDSPKPLSWQADYNPSGDNTYVIYNNSVCRINGATDLKSERCYININSTEPSRASVSQPVGRRRITMNVQNTDAATGFENINASEKPMKLMIDGNIYILRGEKMYDATGRLVK